MKKSLRNRLDILGAVLVLFLLAFTGWALIVLGRDLQNRETSGHFERILTQYRDGDKSWTEAVEDLEKVKGGLAGAAVLARDGYIIGKAICEDRARKKKP